MTRASAAGVFLSEDHRRDLRYVIRAHLPGGRVRGRAGATLRAIERACRLYVIEKPHYSGVRAMVPSEARWYRRLNAAALTFERVIAERVRQNAGALVVGVGMRPMVAQRAAACHLAIRALRRAMRADPIERHRGDLGDPALLILELTVARRLRMAGVRLTQGDGALAQVLAIVHTAIGLAPSETRARHNARRAVTALRAPK